MSEAEAYDGGNNLLTDVRWIGVLVGRSGLAERTERRRLLFAVEAAVGTLVGSGRVGRASWRGAFVGSRKYLARL